MVDFLYVLSLQLISFSLLLSLISSSVINLPNESTENVTAQFCPYMCTIADHMFCNPPPCPPPPCGDYDKYRPMDCCDWCPNGENCPASDGSMIPLHHWKIVQGKNCTCKYAPTYLVCV